MGKSLSFLIIAVLLLTNCDTQKTRLIQRPNIVLINVDDLGWKDLGFMGSTYYETPNLDSFVKEGMVFKNAYAAAANCAPSRACLLSGLNTPRHGVYTVSPSERGDPKTRKLIPIENTAYLKDSIYTLPEMLKSAGYVTGSFGKWHVGKDPKTQGIDVNIGGSSKGNPGRKGYFSPYKIDFISDGPEGEYLTDRLASEAISFIKKNKDTTFFAYIPFYTVHSPLMAKPTLHEKFKNKTGKKGQNNAEYAAMIYALDLNFGKIMDALDALNLTKNTLVIFTSDNGGIRAISEQNPLRAGKGSYYEGGIRVPLAMRWPGRISEASTNENRVSNLDFYPTLQQIVHPKKEASTLDGQSLIPQFKDTAIRKRNLFFHFPIYLEAYNYNKDDGRDPLFRTRPGSIIISGDWKLHHYYEGNTTELYHLKEDVGERKDLSETHVSKKVELQKKLERWLKGQGAKVPTEPNQEYDIHFEKQRIEEAEI